MNKHAPIVEDDAVDEIKVRVGTPEDVHGVMRVALMACEENGFVDPNPVKLLENIWAALNLQHGICGLIGEPGGEVEGVVLLRVGPVWYSDSDTIEEKAIFVSPTYRSAKGGRASKLCEFSKKCSDELGLPLTIGVLSNERTAAKIRMYSRIMGPPAGAYWIYGGHTGAGNV